MSTKITSSSQSSFLKEGWTLKPLVVNMNINLGAQTVNSIDLAQKIQICDVIIY